MVGVHVDARRWVGVGAPSSTLLALRDAVWNDRRVRLAYTNREGTLSRRTLDPLGLVAKAGVWYLVARDGEPIKTFRVQRMSHVRVLDARFSRPTGFDLDAYWSSAAQRFGPEEPPFVATFRMSRHAFATLSLYLPVISSRRIRGAKPARWNVEIAFPSLDVAVHEAIGWDEGAVAIGPPELRRRLAERISVLALRYA